MKIMPIMITLLSLLILIRFYYDMDTLGITWVASTVIVIVFLIFLLFIYGIVTFLKDIDNIIEKKENKSLFYHLYSLVKILLGIIGIMTGIFLAYQGSILNLHNWFDIIIYGLIIFLISMFGIKIVLNVIRAYI